MAVDLSKMVVVSDIGTPAMRAAASVADALRQKAQAALAANATFRALASPSPVQVSAHLDLLTRECTALIKLVLGQLDDATGT